MSHMITMAIQLN